MNVLFAGLSVIVLFVLLFASDNFVEEHLWEHIVKKHLPTTFAWTFGVLIILGFALQHVDIEHWISDNTALMIILATLIGIIPESAHGLRNSFCCWSRTVPCPSGKFHFAGRTFFYSSSGRKQKELRLGEAHQLHCCIGGRIYRNAFHVD